MQTDQEMISAEISRLSRNVKELHVEALKNGYKDEVCPKCKCVLLAHISFLTCQANECPMKIRDGNGKTPTLLEMMVNGVPDQKK